MTSKVSSNVPDSCQFPNFKLIKYNRDDKVKARNS